MIAGMQGQEAYETDPQALPDSAERLRVARIGKPHGIRGEVTAQLFTDDPEQRLAPGSVIIRIAGDQTVDRITTLLTVTRQRWNKSIALLSFREITDRDSAEALRGSTLYVEVPMEEDSDEDGWYSHELAGFACVDLQGQRLGTLKELITGSAQDLLVVTAVSGEDVMVPFVEELVPEVDAEHQRIVLTPPPGLF
ncbi:ribosome maturation factor RimM [Nesterenkonia sp. LB17]|uniref:ribosome maturation factor RimM n=1 Tax=unclassified Nesterenkonia TaxID=2629769 RepID=UPI001F4C8C21|nr:MULTISPECIES: ribosome maturation factor RimM [unclassified Nesterenkonia]MCH8565389.1 ribosome maturation factor RimM [Nesterenkonia sp. LB17]MCH8571306.1 ribosome maturation factor RimM [Nesterenkonia sp. AY15]